MVDTILEPGDAVWIPAGYFHQGLGGAGEQVRCDYLLTVAPIVVVICAVCIFLCRRDLVPQSVILSVGFWIGEEQVGGNSSIRFPVDKYRNQQLRFFMASHRTTLLRTPKQMLNLNL